jgi:hypothetical protein
MGTTYPGFFVSVAKKNDHLLNEMSNLPILAGT